MYVARDKYGYLYLFMSKPVKISNQPKYIVDGYWAVSNDLDCVEISPSLFPEVKWEDEEPTEVELVKK